MRHHNAKSEYFASIPRGSAASGWQTSVMTPAADTPITVRMETGLPNTGQITIRLEPENADDLRRAFDVLGMSTSDIVELSVPEVLETVFQVQNILGSA